MQGAAANHGPHGLMEVFEDVRLMEQRYGANPGAAKRADCTDWQWAIVQLLRSEGPDTEESAAAPVRPRPVPIKPEVGAATTVATDTDYSETTYYNEVTGKGAPPNSDATEKRT